MPCTGQYVRPGASEPFSGRSGLTAAKHGVDRILRQITQSRLNILKQPAIPQGCIGQKVVRGHRSSVEGEGRQQPQITLGMGKPVSLVGSGRAYTYTTAASKGIDSNSVLSQNRLATDAMLCYTGGSELVRSCDQCEDHRGPFRAYVLLEGASRRGWASCIIHKRRDCTFALRYAPSQDDDYETRSVEQLQPLRMRLRSERLNSRCFEVITLLHDGLDSLKQRPLATYICRHTDRALEIMGLQCHQALIVKFKSEFNLQPGRSG